MLHWIGWVLMFVPVTQDKDTESESVLMEKKQKARKYSENLPHHLNQKVWQWNCWMTKSKRKFERRHAQWALPLDPTNGDSWFNKTENPPKEALDKTKEQNYAKFSMVHNLDRSDQTYWADQTLKMFWLQCFFNDLKIWMLQYLKSLIVSIFWLTLCVFILFSYSLVKQNLI